MSNHKAHSPNWKELDPATERQIREHITAGDKLYSCGDYVKARDEYILAGKKFPTMPPHDYWLFSEVLTALGQANFMLKKYDSAANQMAQLIWHYDAGNNPKVLLLLGKANVELGDTQGGIESLAKAYMCGGKDVFLGSEKYYKIIKKVMKDLP